MVPVDLRTDWAGPLTAAGFDRTALTVWLAEDCCPMRIVIDCCRRSPGCPLLTARLGCDYFACPPAGQEMGTLFEAAGTMNTAFQSIRTGRTACPNSVAHQHRLDP